MKYTEQLKQILKLSSWSQEQLASKLGVSFPALNAWVNGRSVPRAKAQERISFLYTQIVGAPEVSEADVREKSTSALANSLSARQIVTNKHLLDTLTLHLTYHTNTIEGSTMTLADVNDVLFDDKVLTNRTAIEQLEAKNHQSALFWLLDKLASKEKLKIDEDLVLNLHLRLMNGIVGDPGQYRKHSVRIMGANVPLANWQKIPNLIDELVKGHDGGPSSVVSKIAHFHAKFEQIHPFSDGNGRTGRLLMLAQALQAKIAPPIVVKERKHAYYKYLELAQVKENYLPLELFVAESIEFSGELLRK
jgi:Fic family protein